MIAYTTFDEAQTPGVFELCRTLGWPSYSEDASTTRQALQAPGATTVVARDGELLVGIAQVFGDGRIQALLALLGVLPSHRRRGIGRELLRQAFSRAGGKWLDLAAEAGSEPFYRAFVHQERSGFRIYPSVTFGDAASAAGRRPGTIAERRAITALPDHSEKLRAGVRRLQLCDGGPRGEQKG